MDPTTAVLSALTGMDSPVRVTQIPVLLELNGLEIFAKPPKRDASQACIGLEAHVQSFHLNVQLNLYGTISKADVCHLTMYVQAELISTDFHACRTVDAGMVKFGATLWCNVFVQRIRFGMVEIVSHVSVACYMEHLDAIVHSVLSLMERHVARLTSKTVPQLHTVSSMAKTVTASQVLIRFKNPVFVLES